MSQHKSAEPAIYGLMAEFDHADDLVAAAKAAKEQGYDEVEGYSPMPVHGLSEVLGQTNKVPLFTLCGAITGLCVGFGLEYWVNMINYPMNIAGKPDFSWPAFVVPAYETTILFGALTAALGMLVMNGLPRPHHPLFGIPAFENATRNRFFLVIESTDPRFDLAKTRGFLEGLHPLSLAEVPN
ncbi:MAG: DUF3341 domain-containing protein [Planctomycetes bacterium]|nr:DUF3341 domain-containing protein [Planctomycetota bacterium]